MRESPDPSTSGVCVEDLADDLPLILELERHAGLARRAFTDASGSPQNFKTRIFTDSSFAVPTL